MPSRRTLSYAGHALIGAGLALAALLLLPDYLRLMMAAGDWLAAPHASGAFTLVAQAFAR